MRKRSEEKELLDLGEDFFTIAEYEHCMKMLFRVNKLFGFFSSTVKLLRQFSKKSQVLDIGCGGGLFLLHLGKLFPDMSLTGEDISKLAINCANKLSVNWKRPNLTFNHQSNPNLICSSPVDIVLMTLVCHHLANDDLINLLAKSYKNARVAVIINDLHRHPFSYWLYAVISPILFHNRLIVHDGLISIKRGFIKKEWHSLLNAAGIKTYEIRWRFPFRWQVILWKNNENLKGIKV